MTLRHAMIIIGIALFAVAALCWAIIKGGSIGDDEEEKERILTGRKRYELDCGICGKEMSYGDKAYGTTMGVIHGCGDGFYADSEPWITVACKKCGEKISAAISNLAGEEPK